MPTDDRDQQLERALARHLRNVSPDAACPDAEILAAYHERTLSLEEMTHWKGHITGCSRCQEALALVEESESVLAENRAGREVVVAEELMSASMTPQSMAAGSLKETLRGAPVAASAPVSMPSKRVAHLPWRWVVPVGALAAALIVWTGVREIQIANRTAKQNIQVAQNREASPPLAPPPPAPAASDELRRELRSAPKSETTSDRIVAPAPKLVEPLKKKEATPPAPPSATANQQNGALKRDYRERSAAKAAPAQPPTAAPNQVAKSRTTDSARSPSEAMSGVAGGAPANKPATQEKQETIPGSLTETVEVTAAPARNASTADLQVGARNEKDLVELAAEDHRFIVAPGQKQAWRVGDGGSIQRSTDGGKTWKKQKSGVTVDLTSGSATSDKVAWIAGKNGTLLLTTDGGKHWKQITTPTKEDLGGVHAVDATHASIWDVTNRKSFETSDGGDTWKPSANE